MPKGTFRDCMRQPGDRESTDFGSSPQQTIKIPPTRDGIFACDHFAIYYYYSAEIAPVGFAIAFGDSAYWTFAFARTTAYTFITNYVCHSMYPPFYDSESHFAFRYPYFNTIILIIQEISVYLV